LEYNIPREIFFECDNSGLRGHEHELFKKRFTLDIRQFSFSNRVIDAWNSLPALCVNSATINCCKTHVSVALEPETVTWNLVIYDSGLRYIWRKPVLTYAISVVIYWCWW